MPRSRRFFALGLVALALQKTGVHTAAWRDEYGTAAQYRPLARTNYMGVAGCGLGDHPQFKQYEGVFTNRTAHPLGPTGIPDGTSNTLLYGEVSGSRWEAGPWKRDISWMAGGGLGTYLGLQQGDKAILITFSSYHPGGVAFCFADGSVTTPLLSANLRALPLASVSEQFGDLLLLNEHGRCQDSTSWLQKSAAYRTERQRPGNESLP